MLVGPGCNGLRHAFHDAHEMAVARIRRIGQQNFIIAINQQRAGQQQRRRAARRHNDALRRNVEPVDALVVAADGLAQRTNAKRTGVINLAAGELLLCGINHRLRRRKIRLTDFHVNHVAATRFEGARMRGNLHHVKRFDVGEAGG